MSKTPEVIQAEVVEPNEIRPRQLAGDFLQVMAARLQQHFGVRLPMNHVRQVVDAKLAEWEVPEKITPVEAARRVGILKPEAKRKR